MTNTVDNLSVVIITRNEEANLPRCLASVVFAEDIVVVDSQSTDRTVAIAREAGARVFSPPWRGFGPAKQHGVQQARGEWILSVDADEVLTPEAAEEIKQVVASNGPHAGYCLPRKTQFLGRWILHSGWYPDYVLRLFRKDAGRFNDKPVHEGVELTGTTGRLSSEILHYSYPTLDSYFVKFNRYTTLAAQEALGQGRAAGAYDIIARPIAKFIKQYLIKGGFLDGLEGLVLAILSSCYVMVKYAKLRHLARGAAGDIPAGPLSGQHTQEPENNRESTA